MIAAELRDMTAEKMRDELLRLRKTQFNLRMQKASGLLGQIHMLNEARRDIARVKTVIREKQNG